jgi:hypothetical protein
MFLGRVRGLLAGVLEWVQQAPREGQTLDSGRVRSSAWCRCCEVLLDQFVFSILWASDFWIVGFPEWSRFFASIDDFFFDPHRRLIEVLNVIGSDPCGFASDAIGVLARCSCEICSCCDCAGVYDAVPIVVTSQGFALTHHCNPHPPASVSSPYESA